MKFLTSIIAGKLAQEEETRVVLVSASRDDISMLISSFREARESAVEEDELRKKVGCDFAEIANSIHALFDIAETMDGLPRSYRRLRFAVTVNDRLIVDRVLTLLAPPVHAGAVVEDDTWQIVTTVDALETSLRCTRAMLEYLWVEEIHALTGYDPDEVRNFEAALDVCLLSAGG